MNFTEWKAEAMRLAHALAEAVAGYECAKVSSSNPGIFMHHYSEARGKARAALEAHLEALPMGAAVAMMGPGVTGQTVAWMSPVLQQWPEGAKYPVDLYRHPKESA